MSRVVEVKGLGKRYAVGTASSSSETFIGGVAKLLMSPIENYRKIRRLSKFGDDDPNTFWALKDVSFNVDQGEVLAIIGKNGAGKSTLLKILSRITDPTRGSVKLMGRVAALLEVGTGFHPELTGRENVFMNGTILGMKSAEVKEKFDEIVEFSGVTKFIDTPVKFYSSGMKVRLAFAVAAHLDPELLIVDEVLSVGDVEFQRRAIGKMQEVTKGQGRTVLFVSHNLRAISQLCTRAVVLASGSTQFDGSVPEAIRFYLDGETEATMEGAYDFKVKSGAVRFLNARLRDGGGIVKGRFTTMDSAVFSLEFELMESIRGARIGLQIENEDGLVIFVTTNAKEMGEQLDRGLYSTSCELPIQWLNEGVYSLTLFAGVPGQFVILEPTKVLKFSLSYLESRGTLLNEE